MMFRSNSLEKRNGHWRGVTKKINQKTRANPLSNHKAMLVLKQVSQ